MSSLSVSGHESHIADNAL